MVNKGSKKETECGVCKETECVGERGREGNGIGQRSSQTCSAINI